MTPEIERQRLADELAKLVGFVATCRKNHNFSEVTMSGLIPVDGPAPDEYVDCRRAIVHLERIASQSLLGADLWTVARECGIGPELFIRGIVDGMEAIWDFTAGRPMAEDAATIIANEKACRHEFDSPALRRYVAGRLGGC